jgi:hypothetical protein
MFRVRTSVSVLASALAVVGAASPVLAQDSWFRIVLGGGHREHDRRPVVISRPRHDGTICRPEPVCKPIEEFPCDLSFTAYQAGDTVILVARGSNRAAGFCTSLSASEGWGRSHEIVLHNVAPVQCGGQYRSTFEVNGSFTSCERLQCLKVRIADQCREVPVTQVGRIS